MNPADLNGPRFAGISTGIAYHSIINLVAGLSLADFKIALALYVLRMYVGQQLFNLHRV